MGVAVATRSEAPKQVGLDLSIVQFSSPLYLAIPVEKVNEILGLIRGFVKEVVEDPEENHQLELPMSLIEGARSEMRAYTDKATKKLERLEEELQSVLNNNSSFGEVKVISHVKEPKSWVEKVVGRLLVESGEESFTYVKDMFRIRVIVENDENLKVVHGEVRRFLKVWNGSVDPRAPNVVRQESRCFNYLSESKENLEGSLVSHDSPWRGIKFYFFTGHLTNEVQINTNEYEEKEQLSDSKESHSLYEKRRTAEIKKRAVELGLLPAFVPFFQQLLHQILVPPGTKSPLPYGITIYANRSTLSCRLNGNH